MLDLIITVVDPGYQWSALRLAIMFTLISVAVLFVGLALVSIRLDWAEALGSIFALFGVIGAITGVLMAPIQPALDYNNSLQEAKIIALEEAGFTDVELEGDKFTASDDGAYFKGALVEVGDLEWQIVEVAK